MATSKPYEICFVCLGNICRSPLAEGVFQALVSEQDLENQIFIHSAGTGNWHVGSPPDQRMQATARSKGITLTSRAQQIQPGDIRRFDLILAMDQSNLEAMQYMCSPETADRKIRLFRSFDPLADGDLDVPDPYYGGGAGFEHVYQIVHRTCPPLLDYVKSQLG
ncbi:MAG: low molecular weight phosphotyrosine protein phosphatase [Nitrospinaceae bacterium]|nr:low molecular weight phosphotyrosine protein phosphatase [Nitrospinaceae bacterium]NIR54948.1 low molecular weight phosphotyrosine protein phosphatase [Nitrospinaceae bacterium]NIS85366.1 low molecular weight phosphotyrosine protein phosphatase [Nitrospinaceae bacterium]NIT82190.1 low molecular weight phosphotyrosine protein phosphatase [Nitrospinaceae bacterium]NIU44434.1 low molecular weight phosphotyrosine protein phosphatase [Nitrospinaceae bacterium]